MSFKPMLEAATYQYNWGYLDNWDQDIYLPTFWVFMLWRLQNHACVNQLLKEIKIAFPDLLSEISQGDYLTKEQLLSILISSRFINRFLQFWGFITTDPKQGFNSETSPQKVEIQPLLTQTFQFDVSRSQRILKKDNKLTYCQLCRLALQSGTIFPLLN